VHSGVVLSDEIDFFLRPQLLHWLVNYSVSLFLKWSTDLLDFDFFEMVSFQV